MEDMIGAGEKAFLVYLSRADHATLMLWRLIKSAWTGEECFSIGLHDSKLVRLVVEASGCLWCRKGASSHGFWAHTAVGKDWWILYIAMERWCGWCERRTVQSKLAPSS